MGRGAWLAGTVLAILASGPVLADDVPVATTGGVTIDGHDPAVQQKAHQLAKAPPVGPLSGHRVADDHSGRKQTGKASIYSQKFQGRKMANGKTFDHKANVAASKTLPLGTPAKVTNLENGKTTVVTVEDRGPYADGRIIDLSKSTASKLGISEQQGLAPVVVAPIAVPQKDGTVTAGAGALPGPATAQ